MKTIYYLALIGFLIVTSCVFNANVPLQNDPPVCLNSSAIQKLLIYPDSSLCTLRISDRNDQGFSLSILPYADAIDTVCPDSQSTLPWPGSHEFLSTGYGTKMLDLFFPTCRMGMYAGTLLLRDAAGAKLTLPYTIQKIFLEPFDSFPVSNRYWRTYKKNDSTHITFDYTDKKLMFIFDKNNDTPASPLSTGIRSFFHLPDSFKTTIDFKLRDEMDDAFEIGFFISSSFDTGKWDGEKAGIFISGVNGQLRLECRSINLQSYSYETNVVSGELGISRIDSTISYFLHDGNPAIIPKPLTQQYFPADLPVFIHFKMTVYDQSKDRHCYWNDLAIPLGALTY